MAGEIERVKTQQTRLFFLTTALATLIEFARAECRDDANVVAVAIGREFDVLLAEARAGVPLTAAIPTPAQFEADHELQAAQAEAEMLLFDELFIKSVTADRPQ